MIETIKAIAADMRHEAGLPSISIAHTALQNLVDSWAARLESITALSNQGEGVSCPKCNVTGDDFACQCCGQLVKLHPATPAEADRRDAERYRAIRNGEWCDLYYLHEGENHKHDPLSRSANERLDAACDAATQEQT